MHPSRTRRPNASEQTPMLDSRDACVGADLI
jgi:hypothetical protein